MKFLADSTFPVLITGPHGRGHHIDRYEGAATDLEFANEAHQDGYQGIVFLGRNAFANTELVHHCGELGLLLVGTTTDEPDAAALAVRSNINAIAARTALGGAVVVRKSGVSDHVPIAQRPSDPVTAM